MRISGVLVVLTVILVFSECWTPKIKWRNPSDPKAKKKNDDFLGLEDIYAKQKHHKPKVTMKDKSLVTVKPTTGTRKQAETPAAANKHTEKQKHMDVLRKQLIELHKKINSLKKRQRRDMDLPDSKEQQNLTSNVKNKENLPSASIEEQEKEKVHRLQEQLRKFQNKLSNLQKTNLGENSQPNTKDNQNDKQAKEQKEQIYSKSNQDTMALDEQILNLDVELEEMLLELAILYKNLSEENNLPSRKNNQDINLQSKNNLLSEKQKQVLDLVQEIKEMQIELAPFKNRKQRGVDLNTKKI